MKVKFTKLAALLLAGAALFATGCTDYEVDIQKVDKKVDDLSAAIQQQIDGLNATIATLETAADHKADIDKVNKTITDLDSALRALIDTKADKAAFEDFKTKAQKAIDDLNALTAGFPAGSTIKGYVDDLNSAMSARVATLENLLAGDWNGKTVKETIDALEAEFRNALSTLEGRVKANEDAIKEINEKTIPALEQRVTDLENKKLDITDFETYKAETAVTIGLLQDAIDELADTKLDKTEFQQEIAKLKEKFAEDIKKAIEEYAATVEAKFKDVYSYIQDLQKRIQSIVFVPDYDDLKITSNMSKMTVPGVDGEFYVDQLSTVTYEILPAQYASKIADDFAKYLTFDIKPVKTRADGDEEVVPEFKIIKAEYDADTVNETGLVTFTVLPVNVASAHFEANGFKPRYDLDLIYEYYDCGLIVIGGSIYYLGSDYYQDWVQAGKWDDELGDFSETWPIYGIDPENPDYHAMTVGLWNYQEILAYQTRTAFAASLRLKNEEKEDAYDKYYNDDVYMEYNEVASTYNALYPGVLSDVEVLPDVYRPEEDEETGEVSLVKATPEYQYLPYTALRGADPCIGEEEDQDPKGYRIYLDQAVPAVQIDGEIMTIADAQAAGYIIPSFALSAEAKFDYSQGTAAEPVDKENFVEKPAKYAEIEMNPEAALLDRFAAVGNVIKGTYTVAAADMPGVEFDVYGEVEITKSLGSVDVNATIVWDYDGGYTDEQGVELTDSKVDHENFYADANLPYGRDDYEVTIEDNDLEENLDVTLADFSGLTPKSLKVTVTYTNEEGEEVKDEVVDDETIATLITDVAINGEKLTADFIGFKWDAVYTVTAVYELPEALITVNGTLTTIDRNREPVVLGPYEHTFIINGEELVEGQNGMYYQWISDALHPDIFKAYDGEEVINVQDNVDFLYPDKQDDFNEAELIGELRMSPNDATKENTATPYVDVNRQEIVLKTKENFNTAALISDQFSTGERSADDPNLIVGKVVTRTVTTYIGEEIEIQMIFNYKVPDYNFLHLHYYTFNTDHETAGITTLYALPAAIEGVESPYPAPIWWTQVNPSYFTDVAEDGADQAGRISNRYALADYDVAYINLAELAFNVVDENDDILEDADMEELGLRAEFIYTDEELGPKDLPEVDQVDPKYLIYQSLWVDNTTFYYRTNEHPYIPALGKLYLAAADDPEIELEVATRFEFPKNAVKFPEEALDYSTYAVVRWTPFQEPKAAGYTLVLDENQVYRVPLFKGMELKDNRPQGTSFYVIKDGEWVVGDAAATATASSKSNGYMKGVKANDAYHITTTFDYSAVELPAELKKLLTVEEDEDGVPYVVFDYTSEVVFHGVVTIPVVVKLENPWQEALVFKYNFIIKGVGD